MLASVSLARQCTAEPIECGPFRGSHYRIAQTGSAVKIYAWILIAGLAAFLLAGHRYPLFDLDRVTWGCLALFFAPIFLYFVLGATKRLPEKAKLLDGVFKWASLGLVAIAMAVFLNGVLDRSAAVEFSTVVIGKSATGGHRSGPVYHLTVSPSWREGKDQDHFDIDYTTWRSLQPGEHVSVEVRRGAFGLPWFSGITPQ